MPARGVLALLIVSATVLFAIGVSSEGGESAEETGAGAAAQVEAAEGGSEAEEGAVEAGAEGGETEEEEGTLLGINTESTPLIVLAVVVSLGLAVAVWLRPDSAAVLALTAAVMLSFAVLDVREIFQQLDESRTGIAVLAAVVALLHGAAAAFALKLSGRRPRSA